MTSSTMNRRFYMMGRIFTPFACALLSFMSGSCDNADGNLNPRRFLDKTSVSDVEYTAEKITPAEIAAAPFSTTRYFLYSDFNISNANDLDIGVIPVLQVIHNGKVKDRVHCNPSREIIVPAHGTVTVKRVRFPYGGSKSASFSIETGYSDKFFRTHVKPE